MGLRAAALSLALLLWGAISAPGAGTTAGDAWDIVLDLPAGDLTSGTFANSSVAWATGLGAIFRSEDGGRTWQTAHLTSDFRFLSGIDASPGGQRGWAAGILGEVQMTNDGGRTWMKQDAGTQVNLSLVDAIDNDTVIVAGEGEGLSDVIILPQPFVIRRTDDGGRSWRTLDVNGYAANSMSFADANHGWIAGSRCEAPPDSPSGCATPQGTPHQALFRTADGGASWDQLDDEFSYRELRFVSAKDGWAIRTHCPVEPSASACPSAVARTHNGGESWTEVRTSPGAYGFGALDALDDLTAIIAESTCDASGTSCANNTLLTDDGGVTWRAFAPVDPGTYATELALAPDGRALQLTGGGGARYSDDGLTWVDAEFPTTTGNGAFDFVDASTGWFAASKLLHTTDAGASWQSVNEMIQPVDVDFVSKDAGWATTYGFDAASQQQVVTVLRTTDGGRTWSEQFVQNLGNYLELAAVDASNVWAYSLYDSLLLHSRNGGIDWYRQALPVDREGSGPGIVFVDARVGWLAKPVCEPAFDNCHYALWRTADGGDTWQASGSAPNPQGCAALIEAVDAKHAWIGGGGCEIIRTTDGGVTWAPADPLNGGSGNVASPTFFDANVGRTVAATCDQSNACTDTLWRTQDGGVTWTSSPTGVAGYSSVVQFVSPERGWRLTQDGGGIFVVLRQRLYRFVGAGPDEVPPPVVIQPPDTGAGPSGGADAFMLPALLAFVAAGLLALGMRRRSR